MKIETTTDSVTVTLERETLAAMTPEKWPSYWATLGAVVRLEIDTLTATPPVNRRSLGQLNRHHKPYKPPEPPDEDQLRGRETPIRDGTGDTERSEPR